MSRAIPQTRSNIGRVAVPVADAPVRPSLVPADVWRSWQRERERECEEDERVDDLDIVEVITSGVSSVELDAVAPKLMEAFLGTSRLFADVDSIARARLFGCFGERRLRPGENLVTPGEVSNLVAVVISGRLRLEFRPRGAEAAHPFELYPGEFVAQTSAFTGTPCRTRISASEEAVLMLLSHRALADLLRDLPALRGMTQRLPALARAIDRDVWCGATGVTGL
ncbi:MAG: cyclic nucleotide-binding domain-containing protein [Myxococcaceae bacterium]